jgi:8-oxo-dGTP pyrophosphatase MutT (NUDIX family)
MFRLLSTGDWPVGHVSTHWTANSRQLVAEVESAIELAWEKALGQPGVHLFDGPMCRLESWQATEEHLTLVLSQSSYKAFLGTNMAHPDFADNHGPAVMANPVGLSAPVLTSDQRLLLGLRNHAVAYYPGRVHPFAGSLEPDDSDVFTAIYRELKEELALAPSEIIDLRCTGIAEDQNLRQPELTFIAEASLTAAEIESRLDPAEHTAIWSIPATANDVQNVLANDNRFTPVAIASLLLWGRLRFGEAWFGRNC